jgi:predicted ArsR family transcriptional regulator
VRHDRDEGPHPRDERARSAPLTAVGALSDAVRRRLYDYVSGCGEPVDREQAAAATGIGRPLAAYHLDKLVSLGLLTAAYRRPRGRGGPGAGRPAKVYARSATEFTVTLPPREYELAARLLVDAVSADASGSALAGLKRAARQHGAVLGRAAQHRRAIRSGGNALRSTEETLAAHGFEPVPDGNGGLSVRGASEELRPELAPVPGRCCVAVRAVAPGHQPSGAS